MIARLRARRTNGDMRAPDRRTPAPASTASEHHRGRCRCRCAKAPDAWKSEVRGLKSEQSQVAWDGRARPASARSRRAARSSRSAQSTGKEKAAEPTPRRQRKSEVRSLKQRFSASEIEPCADLEEPRLQHVGWT